MLMLLLLDLSQCQILQYKPLLNWDLLVKLFDEMIVTGIYAIGINKTINQIQPGSDQRNKKEQSGNENDIDEVSDI